MDLDQLLAERYSCRSFRPDQLSEDMIEKIFDLAQRTPSWCNTQPWQVHLLSSEALSRFARGLGERVLAGHESAGLGLPTYAGVYAERRRESGYGLYSALGIEPENRDARSQQLFKNFSFFGAPHTALITTDRELGTYGAVDCGGYVNTMMLAAQSLGLGVIAQGAIAMYSDFVRDFLDLPDERLVVCAVSFGYADDTAIVNDFRTTRAALGSVVHRLVR